MAALAAACLAAFVMTAAGGGDAEGKRYVVEFDNAFGLIEDGEVKVGGVSAGVIAEFDLTESEPRKSEVTIEITKPGFAAFRTDASCGVRQQSLIGEYFVDCQPGSRGRKLPDGGRVPVSQTSSTVPVDLINSVQRRPYRERFRIILSELGAGLAGRPDELNEVIRRAHPGLRETTQTLEILARQRRLIRDFVRDADRVSVAVEPRKGDLSRWAKEASETAAVQASRKDSIAEQWRKLPTFLGELEPTAAQLERTAGKQIPLLRQLRTAAPELRSFLAELGPFSEDSRPSTRALGEAAVEGRRAIGESREEIAQLRELSTDVPRLAKPLRQFLQTIDDRGRSIEEDPLAAQTAPPAPDKTAYKAGQGFTGMEALLNYVYYQTLGINLFDEVSHVLRTIATQNSCNAYSVAPSETVIKNCNAWLGPSQPGVVESSPDPTEGDRKPTAAAARSDGRRLGRRRTRGQPEAPPTPGERDISKPQIVVPPQLEELIESLRGTPAVPSRAPTDDEMADSVLDFLLSP
ncbi:MAG TPA: MlaD family protein [Thermoleophilaceae bacterium]|jgi:ABC-type transporter Mla subunit MlaD